VLVPAGESTGDWHRAMTGVARGTSRARRSEPDAVRVSEISWRGPGRCFMDRTGRPYAGARP
jgi:hypothetical protein